MLKNIYLEACPRVVTCLLAGLDEGFVKDVTGSAARNVKGATSASVFILSLETKKGSIESVFLYGHVQMKRPTLNILS